MLLFSGTLLITREFKKDSKVLKISLMIAFLGIEAVVFDALENAFIRLVLMGPFGVREICRYMD